MLIHILLGVVHCHVYVSKNNTAPCFSPAFPIQGSIMFINKSVLLYNPLFLETSRTVKETTNLPSCKLT